MKPLLNPHHAFPKPRQGGYILVFTLSVMALILLLTGVTLNFVGSDNSFNYQTYRRAQALSLAEAGVDKAVVQLNSNVNYAGETNTPLGPGTFTAAVTTVDSFTKNIVVTGYIPNASNPKAQQSVRSQLTFNGWGVSFPYALQVGAGGLQMDQNASVSGDLYSNGVVHGASGATITGKATVAASSAQTADQEWLDQSGDFSFGNTSATAAAAQSFIPTVTDKLTQINLYLKKVGTPGKINLRILTDNNGVPSKTVVDSASINANQVSTNSAFVNTVMKTPQTLTADQKYWLELDTGVNATKYYQWGFDADNDFPGNTGVFSNDWNPPNPVWNAANGDMMFQTIMGSSKASLSKLAVGGDALANSLKDCTVGGSAYYQIINNCPVTGTLNPGSTSPTPTTFPISQTQITGWENWAQGNQVIAGPYTVSGAVALGPGEINGDLIINGALTLRGALWVNGKIIFNSGSSLTVDSSLGSGSAMIIADKTSDHVTSSTIFVNQNVTMTSNGVAGNYLMALAMNSDTKKEAIELKNNASLSTIFYAPNGFIDVHNNVSASNLVAYKLHLHNNTRVTYNPGSTTPTFSGGTPTWAAVPGSWRQSLN
ncbi:MAG TPA: hypothetical protein VLE93_02735 [Candidatus Saccharimonadales bacterium]|nr:hypothetical protein [Candidatus Saccharimonadales bacterium]